MEKLTQNALFIGEGIALTLQLLVGGIVLGFLLGALIAVMRYNKMGTGVLKCFVSLIRGTPLILQLSFIYFSAPVLLGIKLSIMAAGLITFGLNSAAYTSEIFRAGIENLPKGQFEAAKTLKIPTFYMWKDIVLPQVVRNILPALVSEVISLLKETALISTIGGMDIMRHSQVLAAAEFTYFMPLCMAGAYYYGFVLLIEYAGRRLEKRGSYGQPS